ncbi:MAG: hypothetical protein HY644_13445 [Acidobacteria bacterium]|nr:hypothetical protein [Acidobacteriota bacterium]
MRFCYLAFIAIFTFLTAPNYATSVRALELEELVGESQQVFLGRVIAIQNGIIPGFDLPYTDYTFAVSEWIKGGSGRTVKIRQANQLEVSVFPGLPFYKKGEEALMFIDKPSEIGLTSPVGLQQGYYHVERDFNGERYIRMGAMLASVMRLQARLKGPGRAVEEAPSSDRIPLHDFLALVRQTVGK